MGDKRENVVERVCPICGKNFLKTPDWRYVEDGVAVCIWSCLCEFRRRKAAKKGKSPRRRPLDEKLRAEIIDIVINQGHTQQFAKKQLGVGQERVSMVIREYRDSIK